MSEDILQRLYQILQQRRVAGDTERSYTARLHQGGLEAILRKVGEESIEIILAANRGTRREIVAETADLWYHLMVMLSHLDIGYAEVLAELERRMQESPKP